jgi:hypothetical protein
MNNFNDEIDLESGTLLRTRKMMSGRYYKDKHANTSSFKSLKKWRDMLKGPTSDVYSNGNISKKSLCDNCTIC